MAVHTVHLCAHDKFIPPFIRFVRQNFPERNSRFFLFGSIKAHPVTLDDHIILVKGLSAWAKLLRHLIKADRVIFHSLINKKMLRLAFLNPWVLSKSYWIPWGRDLYAYQKSRKSVRAKLVEAMRRFVIKRFAVIITNITGDYELARRWYGATGRHMRCFCYPSNMFQAVNLPEIEPVETPHSRLVLIGNSADPSNNHQMVFEQLYGMENQPFQILCPLSYGSPVHRQKVLQLGQAMFGANFIPLTDFIPLEQYYQYLARVDVAVFAHQRQQAMGNIVQLLGLGKKVHLHPESVLQQLCAEKGLTVYDATNITLTPQPEDISERNRQGVATAFSAEVLKETQAFWV